jgi:hypothetical protein
MDENVVSRDPVTEPTRQPSDRPLERLVLERRDPSARVTDDVMVVLATGDHRLVAGSPSSDLDPLHEPDPVQQVERPVDARNPDGVALTAQPIGDLLRSNAAVLGGEQLDDGAPGAARAVPGLIDRLERQFRPAVLGGGDRSRVQQP